MLGVVILVSIINDDTPEANDNAGRVPTEVLISIDEALDDGDLGTGRFTGDDVIRIGGLGAPGEGVYRIDF